MTGEAQQALAVGAALAARLLAEGGKGLLPP